MSTAEKIAYVAKALQRRGQAGSLAQIARLLGVSPSTVTRWIANDTVPNRSQQEKLDLLFRTIVNADQGNEDAGRILGSLLGAAGAGLLGLGTGGILIAAGLGWLMSDPNTGQKGKKR